MGMVMIKCPQTGRAIPTGITIDRESFERSPVFFRRTRCLICNTEHAWFAREAWIDVATGQARLSRNTIDVELEFMLGKQRAKAGGTLEVSLERVPPEPAKVP